MVEPGSAPPLSAPPVPTIDSRKLNELLGFAHELADLAQPIARRYFRKPLAAERKADASPVTAADREIETVLRQTIGARYPEHGIVGEEHGAQAAQRDWVWLLDPIDGTKAFLCGLPLFGTLIGLLHHGTPVLGVFEAPATRERWLGAQGGVSTGNGDPIKTSACAQLDEARLAATSPDMFDVEERARFDALSAACALRRFGGDAYAYALLASGHLDLVVEADLKPYDILPLVPIIEGAGGVVSDWQGEALRLSGNGRVLACANARLWQQALDYLRAG